MAAALPRPANAQEVTESSVEIETPDGTAEAHFAHPASGAHPGVLVWPDAFGLRPAFRQMGTRLAQSGYAVLTVNQYYRTAKVPVFPDNLDFGNPDDRARIMKQMQTLSPETNVTDARAFVGWLDSQDAVDSGKKMGTTGYCMGGPMTMRTAAALPDRIGAGGSFHGGGLVTDQPNSPHRLVSNMDAHYLIAIAENDDAKEPDAKHELRKAFDAAGLPAEIEVYEGTLHGWCPPDAAVYHEEQAERAWSRLLATFEKALV
ncbi:MAG: dienelactone hydrolase family protein [Rhodospirillaceae bacterium]